MKRFVISQAAAAIVGTVLGVMLIAAIAFLDQAVEMNLWDAFCASSLVFGCVYWSLWILVWVPFSFWNEKCSLVSSPIGSILIAAAIFASAAVAVRLGAGQFDPLIRYSSFVLFAAGLASAGSHLGLKNQVQSDANLMPRFASMGRFALCQAASALLAGVLGLMLLAGFVLPSDWTPMGRWGTFYLFSIIFLGSHFLLWGLVFVPFSLLNEKHEIFPTRRAQALSVGLIYAVVTVAFQLCADHLDSFTPFLLCVSFATGCAIAVSYSILKMRLPGGIDESDASVGL